MLIGRATHHTKYDGSFNEGMGPDRYSARLPGVSTGQLYHLADCLSDSWGLHWHVHHAVVAPLWFRSLWGMCCLEYAFPGHDGLKYVPILLLSRSTLYSCLLFVVSLFVFILFVHLVQLLLHSPTNFSTIPSHSPLDRSSPLLCSRFLYVAGLKGVDVQYALLPTVISLLVPVAASYAAFQFLRFYVTGKAPGACFERPPPSPVGTPLSLERADPHDGDAYTHDDESKPQEEGEVTHQRTSEREQVLLISRGPRIKSPLYFLSLPSLYLSPFL